MTAARAFFLAANFNLRGRPGAVMCFTKLPLVRLGGAAGVVIRIIGGGRASVSNGRAEAIR